MVSQNVMHLTRRLAASKVAEDARKVVSRSTRVVASIHNVAQAEHARQLPLQPRCDRLLKLGKGKRVPLHPCLAEAVGFVGCLHVGDEANGEDWTGEAPAMQNSPAGVPHADARNESTKHETEKAYLR